MGSGSGGGGGKDTVTTTNTPWDRQAPYLTFGFNRAQALYNQGGPDYFPKQNYISPSNWSNRGMSDMWQRANQGSPVMEGANKLALDTMRGNYLSPDSNPYLKDYFQAGVDQSLPTLNATFSAAGRTGADAQSQAMGDMYGSISRDVYGGAYENERGRQMAALGFAPTSANQDYIDLNAGLQAGKMKEGYQADKLRGDMERFNYNQNQPYDNLARYMAIVGGNQWGGSQTQQQPVQGSNPLMGALGGGMIGNTLGPVLGLGGPAGIGLGALMGVLGGF